MQMLHTKENKSLARQGRPLALCVWIFLVFISPMIGQSTYQEVTNPEEIQQKLKEIAATTKTIQCDFVQEKKVSFMDQSVTSSGKLYFEKDHLRWEYLKPSNYAILMVKDQLTIVDEGEVNETNLGKNPAFKKVQSLLSHTLTGDFSDQQAYFDQQFQANDSYYRILLNPKEDQLKDYISSMEIYFSKDDFIVHKFIMNENGDVTKTTFSNQQINQALPDAIFNWK